MSYLLQLFQSVFHSIIRTRSWRDFLFSCRWFVCFLFLLVCLRWLMLGRSRRREECEAEMRTGVEEGERNEDGRTHGGRRGEAPA